MTLIVQSTDITNTSASANVFGNSGSTDVSVASGDELVVTNDTFIAAAGGILDIREVHAFDLAYLGNGYSVGTALRMDLNTSSTANFDFDYRISIGPDASITAREQIGFFGVLSTAGGVKDEGSTVEFNNAGSLASISNKGLAFQTIGSVDFTNTGSISAELGNALSFKNVTNVLLINSGTLISNSASTSAIDSAAVTVSSSSVNVNFVNTGSVISLGHAFYSSATTTDVISNSGSMIGDIRMSIIADSELNNTGLIQGDIDTSSGSDTVTNTGTIDGIVELGNDDDFAQNSGQISGDVDLGIGDDVYLGVANGTVGGTIFGDDGNDTITGGAQADAIEAGDDDDYVRAGVGDDFIDGGAGNDTLRAGQGDDDIFGGAGDDFIRGGSGDDYIVGGTGSDTMFGNAGADTFVFEATSDSPDNSGRDLIQDFETGVDVIDLSAFGALTFIGDDAFSGTGGEIRVTTPTTGKTKIFVDVNGDGVADMKIILSGSPVIVEDDFLF